MKKLAALLLALCCVTNNTYAKSNEEKIFEFYNKSLACAAAYHYQVKFIVISNAILPSGQSEEMLNRISPVATSWISISSTLESVLINTYNNDQTVVEQYRFSQFKQIAEVVGRNLLDSEPTEFINRIFISTDVCPSVALEIQEFLANAEESTDQNTPKRKM